MYLKTMRLVHYMPYGSIKPRYKDPGLRRLSIGVEYGLQATGQFLAILEKWSHRTMYWVILALL